MNLAAFDFKTDYNKAFDNIAMDFYIPCMENSYIYDRVSGYFGSTIYIIAWNAIKSFIGNSGKIRIVCSPYITKDDQESLNEGYNAYSSTEISALLKAEIIELFKDNYLSKPYRALACFVAIGALDIKIAVLKHNANPFAKRLFHDKMGIFKDNKGNAVGFRGSMNETFKGLSSDGNIESIDVFPSWTDGEREKMRLKKAEQYFNDLWNNSCDGIDVFNFPQAAKEILIDYAASNKWEELVDEIRVQIDLSEKWSVRNKKEIRTPLPHQINALEGWEHNGYRGIFEHATGSGKTYTAICAINQSLEKHKIPIVIVPSIELLSQWQKELKKFFLEQDINILLCGGGNNIWKKRGYLAAWTKANSNIKAIILTTIDSAASDQFINSIEQGEHLFIVADEVHRLGSYKRKRVLEINSGFRLGLSATPKRFGDEEGTTVILNYFGGIVPPPFTLNDAIKNGVLTKYFYYPHEIKLSQEEANEWNIVTNKLSRIIAQKYSKNSFYAEMLKDNQVNSLLIQRARIIKNASAKIDLSVDIIKQNYENGQRWIIYCDNIKQLKKVLERIKKIPCNAYEYYSSMPGNREETLKYFNLNGGVLVSIKCLDEGVDIPSVTHALILASSKNPREFIQRRGRILRRANGKNFAHLHDAIVTPPSKENKKQLSIIDAELARSLQFGASAENPSCIASLKNIALDFEIELNEANGGYEDDREK